VSLVTEANVPVHPPAKVIRVIGADAEAAA